MYRKAFFSSFLVLIVSVFASCGGGGGGGGGADITSGEKISVTGTLSDIVVSLKPGNVSGPRMAVSDWSGATVKVINSSGAVLGTTTAASNGSYTISDVTSGSNYVVRASTGNLVMKAFIADATADQSGVDVDPTSSAIVMVLASILEKDNLGDEGVDFSTEVGAIDSSTTVSSISSNSLITDIASAIETDIANSYVATATTGASVGSAGTAGGATATSIAQVTPTSTTDVIGTWIFATYNGQAMSGIYFLVLNSDGTATSTYPDCTEGATYTTSGDQVVVTITSASGSACSNAVGDSVTVTYTATSTTLTISGTDSDGAYTNVYTRLSRDSALVGTWLITTVDGQTVPDAGYTFVINSDGSFTLTYSNCVQIGTWTTSGDKFTLMAASVSGAGCSNAAGDSITVPYTVTSTTLTLSGTDSDGASWENVYTRLSRDSALVGTWVLSSVNGQTSSSYTQTTVYNSDGTTITIASGTDGSCMVSGTWSASDGQFTSGTTTSVTGDSCPQDLEDPVGATYTVTSTTLTISITYSSGATQAVVLTRQDTTAGHDSNLVGTWKISKSLGQTTTIDFSVTLNANGTYSTGGTAIDCAETGTWSTSGNSFTATVTSATGADCSMLFADPGTVPYTVSATTFTYYFGYQGSMQSNVYTRQ